MPPVVAKHDVLPSVFGRYLLLRRLSRGGMGEIFLARIGEIQGFEKLCIIKKVLPDLAADQEFIQRFIEEAQIAVKLQHANIASVYEVGRVLGDYFLAIEYVEGRDLRRTLSRCFELKLRLPIQVALFIVCEIAKSLAYAHRRTDDTGRELGIVHCDVSPPNVMLSLEGEVKIIDFGIARSRAQMATSDPSVGFGKFGYMAPEQLIRGRTIDRRTDVYAAGVMLWELLCGERLFSFGKDVPLREVAKTIASGKVAPPSSRVPGLDADLDALVMRALTVDMRDRYQFAEDFRDAIQRKLYQIDPAFSSDLVATFVKQLFEDEIEEQRAFIKAAAIKDLTPFLEELNVADMGTVSFARSVEGASFVGPLPQKPREASHDWGSGGQPTPSPPADVRVHSSTQVIRFRESRVGRLGAVAAAGALMVGGGAVVYALRPPGRADVVAPQPAPVVTAVPVAPPALPPPPEAVVAPAAPSPVNKKPAAIVRARTVEKPRGAHPAEVEARFKALRGEYATFKRAYGPRLEPMWKALVESAVYGRAEERYPKLDGMMSELRREMAKIRNQ